MRSVRALQGNQRRVFNSLVREGDFDTVDEIWVMLTLGALVPHDEIERALAELQAVGLVEGKVEKPRAWRATPHGLALAGRLLAH